MLYEIRLYLLAMFGRIVWRHFIYMYVWPVVLMLAVVNEGSDIVRGGQNDTTVHVIVIICVAAVCCTVLWGKARPHWGRPHVRGVIVCVGDVLSNWENCWYCDDWSWSDFDDDESLSFAMIVNAQLWQVLEQSATSVVLWSKRSKPRVQSCRTAAKWPAWHLYNYDLMCCFFFIIIIW